MIHKVLVATLIMIINTITHTGGNINIIVRKILLVAVGPVGTAILVVDGGVVVMEW